MTLQRKSGSGHSVVLLLAHFIDPAILAEYRKLKRELGSRYDVVLLFDKTLYGTPDLPGDVQGFFFDKSDIRALGYPRKGRSHNSFDVELFAMHFWRSNPHYDFYWLVEYDVRFSGSWDKLFGHFAASGADLLGTTLHRYDINPNWENWRTLVTPEEDLPPYELLRGFFPFYRLSARAFAALDDAYRQGWAGHFECVVPTVLAAAGLELEDIGGNGEFVKAENIDRFYRNNRLSSDLAPGSFIFRPIHSRVGGSPNTLWHPVRQPEVESWITGRRARMAAWLRRILHGAKPPACLPEQSKNRQ